MSVEKAKKIVSEVKTILLDIEGTTTSISFVKDYLFPYAEAHLENFVTEHWEDDKVKSIVLSLVMDQDALKDKEGFIALPSASTGASKVEFIQNVISHLKWQQANDFKTTGLKTLQGLIWMEGYQKKEIVGHLYTDVPTTIKEWKEQGKKIFIYSSGSVAAQKLLFKHSEFGDLDVHIDGNFDTLVGPKTEPESYIKIGATLNENPQDIVFFTDRPKEVAAAKTANMKVIRVERGEYNPYLKEENKYLGQEDATIPSFSALFTS